MKRAALLLVVLGACAGGEPTDEQKAANDRKRMTAGPAPAALAPQEPGVPRPSSPPQPAGPGTGDRLDQEYKQRRTAAPTTPEPRAQAPAAAAAAAAPKRDHARELADAIGSPIPCLETRPSEGPAKIQIQVAAVVMGSGAVSRANVSSSALSEPERKCIERRAEAAKLKSLDEDQAPLRVTTTIVLEKQPGDPAK